MTAHKRDNRTRKGFTLVELLVVIVILSLLAGITAPRIIDQIEKSRWDLTKPQMVPIETAIGTYLTNCGEYPDNLNNLLSNPGFNSWTGPYLKPSQLKDPWGFEYGYAFPGTIHPDGYDIISYGKDGVAGGDGYYGEQYND